MWETLQLRWLIASKVYRTVAEVLWIFGLEDIHILWNVQGYD